MKIKSLLILFLFPISALANDAKFMESYYDAQAGNMINVMSPNYVDITIGNDDLTAIAGGIDVEKLYDLKDEDDNSITLNYSHEKGVYIVHISTSTEFNLTGKIRGRHPIDTALMNCYSVPAGETTMGEVNCLSGAENAWHTELERTYRTLGGESNAPLKSAMLAWVSYRDAQFNWFNSFFSSKEGSKWISGIGRRRVLLVRQQAEHFQSFYDGY